MGKLFVLQPPKMRTRNRARLAELEVAPPKEIQVESDVDMEEEPQIDVEEEDDMEAEDEDDEGEGEVENAWVCRHAE